MRNPSRILALALVAALTLVSTACGDDDGGGGGNAAVTDESRPYVDAMKKAMLASAEDDNDFPVTEDQADCLAPRWVNTLRVDRLEEKGITPEDLAADSDMDFTELGLTEDEGGALYDAFGQCDVNLAEAMMADMAGDEDMSDAAKACMEGVFTDENLRKLMVSSMVNGEDAAENDPELAPLMGQLMGCAFMGMGDAEEKFEEVGSSISE